MSLDAARLGTTIDVPLDPTAALPVSPTGGLVLLAGRDALNQDLLRRVVVEPGSLLYRPEFGCGALSRLGGANSPTERARFGVGARRNLLRDPRIKDATVGVAAGTDDNTAVVTLSITLRDDTTATIQAAV